jgi:mono/diheme cytochrome c family protein
MIPAMTTRPLLGLAAGLVLLAACTPAEAPPEAEAPRAGTPPTPGEIGEGQAIAERQCSACHAVGPEGASPEPAAPPFRTLGERWPVEFLAEALAEGIVVGHDASVRMPEFRFEPDEIDALLAYLETLQPAPPPEG